VLLACVTGAPKRRQERYAQGTCGVSCTGGREVRSWPTSGRGRHGDDGVDWHIRQRDHPRQRHDCWGSGTRLGVADQLAHGATVGAGGDHCINAAQPVIVAGRARRFVLGHGAQRAGLGQGWQRCATRWADSGARMFAAQRADGRQQQVQGGCDGGPPARHRHSTDHSRFTSDNSFSFAARVLRVMPSNWAAFDLLLPQASSTASNRWRSHLARTAS